MRPGVVGIFSIEFQRRAVEALYAPFQSPDSFPYEYDIPRQDERAWAAFMEFWAGTPTDREALREEEKEATQEQAHVTKQDLYCISIAYTTDGSMTGC